MSARSLFYHPIYLIFVTLHRWWVSVDRVTLYLIIATMAFGGLVAYAATPAIAQRIGMQGFGLATKQLMFIPPAVFTLIIFSMMPINLMRRLVFLLFIVVIASLALLPILGSEIKGATRWYSALGISLQPSEFFKGLFSVVSAWLIILNIRYPLFRGFLLSWMLMIVSCILLLLEPDVGQTLVILSIWCTQAFIAGLRWRIISVIIIFSAIAMSSLYLIESHVRKRVDDFITYLFEGGGLTDSSLNVVTSVEALQRGGWFGSGIGEGRIKLFLPEAHADFVFSVIGEEFGIAVCLLIIICFWLIIVRVLMRIRKINDLFCVIVATGIITQFTLQSLINIGTATRIIPAKGMTLPFLSYGGSSLLGMALSMGILLCITRIRPVNKPEIPAFLAYDTTLTPISKQPNMQAAQTP